MYQHRDQRDFARTMRNQPTEGEKRLWHFLRRGKLGAKFRRQAAIGPYIVDFACFSHRLIIELDGPHHERERAMEYDRRRDQWLAEYGYRVMRFQNQALDECIAQVVDEIQHALVAIDHSVSLETKTPRDAP